MPELSLKIARKLLSCEPLLSTENWFCLKDVDTEELMRDVDGLALLVYTSLEDALRGMVDHVEKWDMEVYPVPLHPIEKVRIDI